MFVPEYDSLPRLLPKICDYLTTDNLALQEVAIGCLRQLSQRNPVQDFLKEMKTYRKNVKHHLHLGKNYQSSLDRISSWVALKMYRS